MPLRFSFLPLSLAALPAIRLYNGSMKLFEEGDSWERRRKIGR